MKTLKLLILIVILIGTISCQKDENVIDGENSIENPETGLYFSSIYNISETVVKNDEIIGYDSTKHIFSITETAWNRIEDNIKLISYGYGYGFNVSLNNNIVYRATYIPFYSSTSYYNIITFMLIKPNLVYIKLGYPTSDHFTGIDYRNDSRIITQLKNEKKLIEIKY